MDTENNISRDIRKEFFAFRNGIVAEKLRKAGDPHGMIMGCLLSDLMGIAQRVKADVGDEVTLATIASELWSDTNSRECRLTAPMLYPATLMSAGQALQWCQSVETTEVADNLCHKLLRHIDGSNAIFRQLISQDKPLLKYTGYRLLLNLLLLNKVQRDASLRSVVENEAATASSPLNQLLGDILEELDEVN